MSTDTLATSRRAQAIQDWTEAVFATYPFETTGFIRTQSDRFANPVGFATRAAAEVLYDAIIGMDVDMDKVHSVLQEFIRVRAVQEFRPDQAVGVLFLFRPVLRKWLLVDMMAAGHLDDYLEMESRVDSLALVAFNHYMVEREKVYAERVAEQRRGGTQLARWAAKHGMMEEADSATASCPVKDEPFKL